MMNDEPPELDDLVNRIEEFGMDFEQEVVRRGGTVRTGVDEQGRISVEVVSPQGKKVFELCAEAGSPESNQDKDSTAKLGVFAGNIMERFTLLAIDDMIERGLWKNEG